MKIFEIQDAFSKIVKNKVRPLTAYLHEVEKNLSIDGTNAICHFHCVNLDGNGQIRIDGLVEHLSNCLIDYAIPRKEMDRVFKDFQDTGSAIELSKLSSKAKGLFTSLSNSGESGELLLFLFAEYILKLPQLISKMSLKTNSQLHYNGADGIHIGVSEDTKKLCLYWGESKLYKNPSNAIYECMKSIAPLLKGNGTGYDRRDLHLLSEFMNVNDPDLMQALVSYLDPDDPNFNLLEYRGICLIAFDHDCYGEEGVAQAIEEVTNKVSSQIDLWNKNILTRITAEDLAKIKIHVFLLPFPSVEVFRQKFNEKIFG
ncbi:MULTISPECIES: DUF1837 domain-containing protein [Acinetobacter]|uniref:HamA C-terminal domain-containing protein n=1 Tax=Acinetobacter TaxID=469 RepID=UPI001490836E|nr:MULTISPECIES: DUF1837 domain-containing protein [Acinetobacter]MCS4298923.1 hypothetical protein [Acinetobacter guillouiae]MCW2252339.1 hypothetical protein [Acinetobacter sp. BIGb0204]NII38074.1 hypothetical protein [Acinetobacter sp. BIGb0196]